MRFLLFGSRLSGSTFLRSTVTRLVFCLLALALSGRVVAQDCPALLDHEMRKLRSEAQVDLCDSYQGKTLLVVNTASHCGYTPQFKALEEVNQKYKDRGLVVLGFSSDDFNQEAETEELAAEVCYVNYGVTFDMFSTIPVKGEQAHPLFKELAQQSQAPSWNFFKYLVSKDGKVIKAFPSAVNPDSEEFLAAIESAL